MGLDVLNNNIIISQFYILSVQKSQYIFAFRPDEFASTEYGGTRVRTGSGQCL